MDGPVAGGSNGTGGWRAGVKIHLLIGCALNEGAETDRNHLQFHIASAFLRLGDYVGCAVLACNGGRGDSASGVRSRGEHASEASLRMRTATRAQSGVVYAHACRERLLCIVVSQWCMSVTVERRIVCEIDVGPLQTSYVDLSQRKEWPLGATGETTILHPPGFLTHLSLSVTLSCG